MKMIVTAVLALALTACGGGGGSSTPAAPQTNTGNNPPATTITAPLTLGTAKWGQAVWH